MYNYGETYDDTADDLLVQAAVQGSGEAITQLVERHQQFIYNVALKFIRDADDAMDLTQEVLIKMTTKLHQYQHRSQFRTWLYRMVFNHFLNCNKKKSEQEVYSFDELGGYVERVHNGEGMTDAEQQQYSEEIIAVRNRCMTSTLLCLTREQRMVLILGAIFNIRSSVAAEVLDMTADNFRQQLSRAKADLYNFMDNRCGLINPANSCRCHKKAKGFMKEGLVNKETGQFEQKVVTYIKDVAVQKNKELDYLMEQRYLSLFTNQPYHPIDRGKNMAAAILQDPFVRKLFALN